MWERLHALLLTELRAAAKSEWSRAVAVPAVRGRVGRPRQRTTRLAADRGYDHDKYRRQLRRRAVAPEIARGQTEHGSGLGRYRWVVERTFAWLHHLKRLLVRYARRAEIDETSSRSAPASSASEGYGARSDSSSDMEQKVKGARFG